MIKAVFFDLYNTLVQFDPPREQLQASVLREVGLELPPEAIRRAYPIADDLMTWENARLPIGKRSEEGQRQFWSDYEATLLREAGAEVAPELAFQVFTRLRQLDIKLVLYDDALPTLSRLRSRDLILGLVSNITHSLDELLAGLGLTPYLDFYLASQEVGVEKPDPRIFLVALEQAQVQPSEAIHVGDQYHSDVKGALGVGIKPLLLDRDGFREGCSDCTLIRSLAEVMDHL